MKEKLNLALYELKYAFIGIKRHLLLCLSAISAITISLFLMAAFLVVGIHVDHFATNVQSDLSIHVILDQDIVEDDQIDAIEDQILELSNVDSIEFSDKENELELMIDEKGDAFSIYKGEENPLSNAFFVYVQDEKQIQDTSEQIEQIEGVSSSAYGGSSVTQLINLLDMVRKVGYGVILLLLILSIYLIFNTIRTTIFSRQEEIIIMRQVGGTNAFIKRPFEVQGVLIGLFGSLLPVAALYFGYAKLYEVLEGQLFSNLFSLIKPNQIVWQVGLIITLIGLLIGGFASFWAVTKYLKVKR
ncbi:permease-like cell division protein FtsX [Faecalitalea cylindroides]|uniref:permease-like cell division protein FtsX n=1 Tax=Faecalitalea cylindroides TaxID=39483 RepID=UPI002E79AE18|nr:permease-like cell division protein FtsX [Faecalitalea cylindroides]MEE1448247.1 permease-like cell division protein FtsX [Faecalitalea cylindroides]